MKRSAIHNARTTAKLIAQFDAVCERMAAAERGELDMSNVIEFKCAWIKTSPRGHSLATKPRGPSIKPTKRKERCP